MKEAGQSTMAGATRLGSAAQRADTASASDPFRAELVALLPRLRRFALTLTRGQHDAANELVQASCARALEKRAQWQTGTNLDRWLFKILNSIWLNEHKARRVRDGQGRVETESLQAPVEAVDSRIDAQRVLDRVMTLPERWRKCVLLVYVEGYTYEECARILDMPIGTVMSSLSRARLRLSDASREGR